MTTAGLSPAQLEQRRVAAVKSGATSRALPRPLSTAKYERLRRRVVRSTGKTSTRLRLQLQMLAVTLARIELAEAWLAQQPDPLFANPATGELHPLIARVDHWCSIASAGIANLPDAAKRDLEDAFPVHGRRTRG